MKMPRRRVDRRVFEKVISWLINSWDRRELPEEFSNDFLYFCCILKDISRGKDSPNYHVLKKCAWNNEVVEQFIIENANLAFSYFVPLELKESYYDILNVSFTCSPTELRRRWLDLMKVYHPDKFGARGIDVTKKINEAYEVLSDPERRREYEEQHPHVLPVVLKETTWKEIASNKVAYLLAAVSHWKDLYVTTKKIIKSYKDSSVNIAHFPSQQWLGVMIKKNNR